MILNVLLAAILAIWRYFRCYEYVYVPFDKLLELSVPMPFASRVLIPWLAHALHQVLGLSAEALFLVFDLIFAFVFFEAFRRLLSFYNFGERSSAGIRLGFCLYIALLYTNLSHLYIFYPWDLPSAAFLLLGIYAVTEGKYALFFVTLPLAVLNRETAILYPLVYFGIAKVSNLRKVAVTAVTMGGCCLLEFAIQRVVTSGQSNELLLLMDYSDRLHYNFSFIQSHPFVALLTVLPVPLFWILAGLWYPGPLRGLIIPVLCLYLAAFFFGNADEPRVFVEAVVATMLPAVCWYRAMRRRY